MEFAPSPAGYVACPDCGKIMNRQNFGKRSGVIIDVCRGHGTWFDADELSRVIAFVEGGGLEASLRKDADQRAAEVSLQRINLVLEQQRSRQVNDVDGRRSLTDFTTILRSLRHLL